MIEPANMEGKVALVTGAAAGLGRATALKLAKAGADVCLVDIDGDGLARVADEVHACDVRALALSADLSVSESCASVVADAVRAFARLDALCNVAAVMIPRHAEAMTAAEFQTTLAVNLAAPYFLFQAAAPHLLEVKGAVVNVASVAGIAAQAYNAAYCASKAGLIHMTKSLAMEYMKREIRINAVAPGGMMTALARNMMTLQDADVSLTSRYSPMRGLVDIDVVASMTAYLASDAAAGYHGACIAIDNGMSAG